MELETARTFELPAPPPAVWDALCRVEDYPRWWPWLRRLDAEGLVVADRWQCRIRPPLPFEMRLWIAIEEVVPHTSVRATVGGDVEGDAAVRLDPSAAVADGTTLAFTSSLRPSSAAQRTLALLLPGLARAAHDRVVDTAFRQFSERAL